MPYETTDERIAHLVQTQEEKFPEPSKIEHEQKNLSPGVNKLLNLLGIPSLKHDPWGAIRHYAPETYDSYQRIYNRILEKAEEKPGVPTLAIFSLDGQLKGRKRTNNRGEVKFYEWHSIKNFAGLIQEISLNVLIYNLTQQRDHPSITIPKQFSHILSKWRILAAELGGTKSLRRKVPFDVVTKITEEIETLNTIVKESIAPFKQKSDLAIELFNILKEHVPEAPDQTITKRISDLLCYLNMPIQAETIRRRLSPTDGNNPSQPATSFLTASLPIT